MTLKIKDLSVSTKDGLKILDNISLNIKEGEVVVLMGPNGSGKSTLANVIMGNPNYIIDSGDILYNEERINDFGADERARRGVFLSFQYPAEISGVTISNFLRTALNSVRGEKIRILDFKKLLKEKMEILKIDEKFSERYLNEGFSGGEKKKTEILQMAVLEPKLCVLDETDSGLDADALRIVGKNVTSLKNGKRSFLIITHYNRILNYVKPDRIYVMKNGKVVKEGDENLAFDLENKGYENLG
ncbi:MAG: FeS assembly ATPase SufC [Berkelbacteria bacterium GW2011_GWA1_36_9]|uniref:FeS assembly ATPase SufC n=1 Tax=Berkelbacteria bacterium GW2011_GWA1_36_9 TaxID=1618331 RepID=A0A0G0I090_9BACT|nr:MAG: FeS assembly ATPase SufC [Berkelbacteria bacterium GW2011_GWA1_36_9]